MTMLERVNKLEQAILDSGLPAPDLPVWHHFAPGLYARQMLIRAGIELTGAVHRTEHLCIVTGVIEVTDGETAQLIAGQQVIMTSKPGVKRAGRAITDTYFTTVHATEERDLDKLVEELTFSKSSELLGGPDNKQTLRLAK